jgi:uncharacterized oligopeptide transporter (OPT) family protein
MPLTARFTGIIPALEYLKGPDENGLLRESFANLVLWLIGLCFFGIIFAALLREHFIEREQLPWPAASATALRQESTGEEHSDSNGAAES